MKSFRTIANRKSPIENHHTLLSFVAAIILCLFIAFENTCFGQPANISVTASPTSIPADGVSTSAITATVTDGMGQPMQGQQVGFSTDLGGIIPPNGTTDANGQATSTLTSAMMPGTATVTAACAALNDTVQVAGRGVACLIFNLDRDRENQRYDPNSKRF